MTYEDLLHTSATAHAVVMSGGSAEDVAVALYAEVQHMTRKAVELSSIAPFRVRAQDGREYVYRCPDRLAPLRSP
jgi:hypothetical protein